MTPKGTSNGPVVSYYSNRATIDDAHHDERIDAMKHPNWKKQTNMNDGRPQADHAVERNAVATPVTEAELEAYRFRGTPIRRTVSPIVPQPPPASPHGDSRHGLPGKPNERLQPISGADEKHGGSENITGKAPKTPRVS
jgi:hypothetical protein